MVPHGTVCHQRLFSVLHSIQGYDMCSLPAWARRACSSALLFISKPLQGNWCPVSFRWAEVRFYVMLFFFSIFFLTKCTLTFQCAATLGEERMRASLVGDNGETYHWKAPKPLVKSSARLCQCECKKNSKALYSRSTFVFPSWLVQQRLAPIDFLHTNLLPPSIIFIKRAFISKFLLLRLKHIIKQQYNVHKI